MPGTLHSRRFVSVAIVLVAAALALLLVRFSGWASLFADVSDYPAATIEPNRSSLPTSPPVEQTEGVALLVHQILDRAGAPSVLWTVADHEWLTDHGRVVGALVTIRFQTPIFARGPWVGWPCSDGSLSREATLPDASGIVVAWRTTATEPSWLAPMEATSAEGEPVGQLSGDTACFGTLLRPGVPDFE